ncbi:unnamed protein product [Paramecium octaurelia]|uniref:Uncharacterized protein n=1 Tax=Paramecium octaurelia TaxID=43137 RepID=A0A8S1X0Y6_PAROT|nr:unnamed protein product [Paramecium octaurelia]
MSIQIKNTKRNELNSSYQGPPGPASYNPQLDSSYTKPPKWTIRGGNQREILVQQSLPGPGQYHPKLPESQKKTLIHGKSYQFDKEKSYKPGPGSYKIEVSQLSKIGFKIGSQKRYKEDQKRSPGPGDYEIISKSNVPSFKVGKQSRSEKKVSNTVGPGYYNMPSLMKTDAGFKIIPRREKTIQNITPAPNAYEIQSQERVKSFKIGTSKRDGIFNKSISPGPGDYSVEIVKEQAGYSIGRSQRSDKKIDSIPGPGYYKFVKPSNAPKYSIYERHKEKSDMSGPGPQSYTIGDFKDTKTVIFGHAKRDSYSRLIVPGPGEYETDAKQRKPHVSIVFGREKRSQSCSDHTSIPGPGQYEISTTFYAKKK